MKLQYLAHACFMITTDEGLKIVIDPWLDQNPLAPIKSKDITADYIILSHAHGDHCSDALKISNPDTTIIAVSELASYFKTQAVKTHAMQIGGSFDFEFGTVKLVTAEHGSMTFDGRYGGLAAGIILEIGGITLYHMGDTGLFGDLRLIGEMFEIDYLMIPIGGNYTMGPQDAALAAKWLEPRLAIPMHFNTFPQIRQNPRDFIDLCESDGILAKVMEPGEELLLKAREE